MTKTTIQLLKLAITGNKREVLINGSAAVVLEFVSVGALYLLNRVYGDLYAGIQAVDPAAIWLNMGLFACIAMVLVLVNGYMAFFINRLAFAIRVGITNCFLTHIMPVPVPTYNQRIQEDVKKFAESSCDLWFAVLKAGLHLPVFIGVVVTLTKWYIGLGIVSAVVAGTILTRVVARRLIDAQSEQETNEARFRETLTAPHFAAIQEQFQVLNRLFKRLAFTQSGLGQAFVLLPFITLMPLYIAKAISMGQFFQSVNALAKVIDALSVLIDSRQVIVTVETTCKRLQGVLWKA